VIVTFLERNFTFSFIKKINRYFQEEILKIKFNVGKYRVELKAKTFTDPIIELNIPIIHFRLKSLGIQPIRQCKCFVIFILLKIDNTVK